MKIAVATEFSPAYQQIADVTLPVLKRYCDKHDYELCVIDIPDGGFHYRKIEWLQEKFKTDVEAVFYLDVDALITNLSVPIENFIDDDCSLFITRDAGGINGGSLIIRNSHIGNWMLELILSLRDNFNNEQEVLEHLMKSPQFNQFVKVLPHPSINSYRMDLYKELIHLTKPEDGMWHEGDFVLHTPALLLEQRAEVLKNTKITE